MTLGVLEYLISVNDSGVKSGVNKSENTIKRSAERAGRSLKEYGGKVSAWTIAKGQMLANVTTKAVKTLTSTTKQLVKSSIMAFSEFEQIEGGARLVWGNTFSFIEKRAKEAYKNVQMSATEYMEQANYYAVGLKNALNGDTEAAAKLADNIITAQADIVAALGIDADRVQNAFTGIMRGNYTMLDNLGLGIAGTKAGMEDVIKQVNDWHKANKRQTQYSMKSLADQQAALVDFVEMQGLSGYASGEAANTIQGSLASVKAAWKDFLVSMGSGKNIRETSKNLTKSVKLVLKNITPVAANAVKNIFSSIKEILPELKSAFRGVWTSIKESFGDNPLISRILDKAEDLMGFFNLLTDLMTDYDGTMARLENSQSPILQGFASMVRLADQLTTEISQAVNSEDGLLFGLLGGAVNFVTGVMDQVARWLGDGDNQNKIVKFVTDTIKKAVETLPKLLKSIAGLLKESAGPLIKSVVEVFKALIDIVTDPEFIHGLAELIKEIASAFVEALPDILNMIVTSIPKLAGAFSQIGVAILQAIIDAVPQVLGSFINLLTSGDIMNAMIVSLDNVLRAVLGDQISNTILGSKKELRTIVGSDGKQHTIVVSADAVEVEAKQVTQSQYDQWLAKRREEEAGKIPDLWTGRPSTYAELDAGTRETIDKMLEDEGAFYFEIVPDLADGSEGIIQSELDGMNPTVTVNPMFNLGDTGNGSWWSNLFGNAKGNWSVPYDNFPALLHRDEMVLTKSQARRYRDGEGSSGGDTGDAIAYAVEKAMSKVYVMMSGEKVGDLTTRRIRNNLNASSYSKLRAYGG